MLDILKERWLRLRREIELQGDMNGLFDIIVEQYSHPIRKYHNLNHIIACLFAFDLIKDKLQFPMVVEFVLWVHDIIYDPLRHDNEQRSANWALSILRSAGVPERFNRRVYFYILYTRHQVIPFIDEDALYILDIDLLVLGSDRPVFEQYERHIREEYSEVADYEFMKGRREILIKFRGRPSVFKTEYFRSRYEKQAQQNLDWAISRLSSKT